MDEFINKFSVGSLDLLFKIGYADLEEAMGDNPQFMWWGLFMIQTNQPLKIVEPFCIVDNIDDHGSVFLVKDLRFTDPIVINKGVCPAVCSVAEMNKNVEWFHVGLSKERERIATSFQKLLEYCQKVELVCNTVPMKMLKISIGGIAEN